MRYLLFGLLISLQVLGFNGFVQGEEVADMMRERMPSSYKWLTRHQSNFDMPDPDNEDKKIILGAWFTHAWDMECAGKGGKNSVANKFPGVCKHNHLPGKKKAPYFDGHWGRFDLGTTGMALLAYAGAGETHKRGRYKKPIRRAVHFLCSIINMSDKDKYGSIDFKKANKFLKQALKEHPAVKNGSLNTRSFQCYTNENKMLQHAIITLAMAEIYGVSRDAFLKQYVVALARYLIKNQGDKGWGKSYGKEKAHPIVSVFGTMGIKASKAVNVFDEACQSAGLKKEDVFKKLYAYTSSLKFEDKNQKSVLPETRLVLYLGNTVFLYRDKEMRNIMKPGVKLLMSNYLDGKWLSHDDSKFYYKHPDTEKTDIKDSWLQLEGKVKIETKKGEKEIDITKFQATKKYSHINTLGSYFATLGLFQYGGDEWSLLYAANLRWWHANQIQKETCGNGSYTIGKAPGSDFPGFQSVIMSTAIETLKSQVHYRYIRHIRNRSKIKIILKKTDPDPEPGEGKPMFMR